MVFFIGQLAFHYFYTLRFTMYHIAQNGNYCRDENRQYCKNNIFEIGHLIDIKIYYK